MAVQCVDFQESGSWWRLGLLTDLWWRNFESVVGSQAVEELDCWSWLLVENWAVDSHTVDRKLVLEGESAFGG